MKRRTFIKAASAGLVAASDKDSVAKLNRDLENRPVLVKRSMIGEDY